MRFSYPGLLTLALFIAQPAGAAPSSVSQAEQAAWVNWVIPLPKQIAIDGKVQCPAAEVKVTLAGPPSQTVTTAAEVLRTLLRDKGGAEAREGRFEILLGTCGGGGKLADLTVPEAAQLAKLPNSQQAYVICPAGDARLVLAALDPRGVYYAAQTLRQLLEGQFAGGQVAIPLARVTDWPDLAERGLWGGSANRDIVWMAGLKMNLVESHVEMGLTDEGRAWAKVDPERIDLSRRHALNYVPILSHLNGMARRGLYRCYPGLHGKGERAVLAKHKDLVAPCASQPKLAEVLAEWLTAMADNPGVTDICAWLSELERQECGCDECRQAGVGQHALEARSIVKAYRIAQKKHPTLRLRVLLTQGSYPTNDKVLAEIPPDVGVTYYDGGRTYDSSREPMIYGLLEEYAARGRWLGCYPQLTPSWRIVCPWSGPQFIRCRMNEFVDKKLQCLCGYATPDNRLWDFNVQAAAEWSWNAKGRDERQFAAAWATRRGLPPAETAEWAVTLGPVGWDVYGSRIPASNFMGRAPLIIAGRRKPVLGQDMFRYFPSVEHMDADLAACQKALEIAKKLNQPLLVLETEAIHGYVRMVRAIYDLALQGSASKQPTYAERVEMQKALGRLCIAGMETNAALRSWEALCSQGSDGSLGGTRFLDTLDATEKTVADIARALEKLGIRNPLGPYLRADIGRWAAEDFDPQAHITKVLDVTQYTTAPGTYEVGFTYTGGWNGLGISRVALVSAPADKPDARTELAADKHDGGAAVRNRANVYTLKLDRHDPAAKYFIVAEIRGTSRHGRPPERQGCEGVIWIKGRMPDDWRARIESAKPLADEDLPRKR